MLLKSVLTLTLCLLVSTGQGAEYDQLHCHEKQAIVHLFEWKWSDIAEECERFLGPQGFCGVQVSPPNEHLLVPESDYPWWQRYQAVSYILGSRSGNETEFASMVKRCNAVGVRIIVDVVFNHMTAEDSAGHGSAGSHFNGSALHYPAVPYQASDFTPSDSCPSKDGIVHDYQNAEEVRNCYLYGLVDLNQKLKDVRKKISDYLNHLVKLGVAGFRVDSSKYMWPDDLHAIQNMTNNLSTDAGFHANSRPFFLHHIDDPGDEPITVKDYTSLGRVTEFRYGINLKQGVQDFTKLKDVYDPASGMAHPGKAVVFTDNQDTQRDSGVEEDVLTFQEPRSYKMGVTFTLAYDYGFTRLMSSFNFTDGDQGPPSSKGGHTNDVPINNDGSCGGGWVCEHRWTAISRMIAFSNTVNGTSVENWYQKDDTVAFSRGNKGFFAMNQEGSLDHTFQTGLPAGNYCDVISNCATAITVESDGTAQVTIKNKEEPMVAFCVGCLGKKL